MKKQIEYIFFLNLKVTAYNSIKSLKYLETDLPTGLQALYGGNYEAWLRVEEALINGGIFYVFGVLEWEIKYYKDVSPPSRWSISSM